MTSPYGRQFTVKSRRRLTALFLLSGGVILGLCSGEASGQLGAIDQRGLAQTPTTVTLWMGWERGDPHYGHDVIRLRQPCQNSNEVGCVCRVRFATRSPQFADYIASFGENKVPVVYRVIYGSNGQAIAANFLSVGTWSRDKLSSPNDGLIGIEFRNEVRQKGQQVRHRVSLPAACFSSAVPTK